MGYRNEGAHPVNRAVFLDRDGVINRRPPEGDYITRWEDFDVLPGVAESISLLNQAGFLVAVVTNQRCIAKGLVSDAEVAQLHRRMTELLAKRGAKIDAVYCCPHELDAACKCRKPSPGMLLDAAREHDIDPKESWMIGDSEIDIEAGRNAGCKTARLASGSVEGESASADIVASSLPDAVRQMLDKVSFAVGAAHR